MSSRDLLGLHVSFVNWVIDRSYYRLPTVPQPSGPTTPITRAPTLLSPTTAVVYWFACSWSFGRPLVWSNYRDGLQWTDPNALRRVYRRKLQSLDPHPAIHQGAGLPLQLVQFDPSHLLVPDTVELRLPRKKHRPRTLPTTFR